MGAYLRRYDVKRIMPFFIVGLHDEWAVIILTAGGDPGHMDVCLMDSSGYGQYKNHGEINHLGSRGSTAKSSRVCLQSLPAMISLIAWRILRYETWKKSPSAS